MAVDVGLISPIGLANEALTYGKLMPDFAADALKRRELAIRAQEEHRLSGAQQTKERRLAEYHDALLKYQAAPTDEGAVRLMMEFPEFSTENKGALDVQDKANVKLATERVGAIDSAIGAGNLPLAIQQLEERQAADAKAGKKEDTLATQVLTDLKSGDAAAIKRATAAVKTMMASAMGPQEFTNKVLGKDKSEFEKKLGVYEERAPKLVGPLLESGAYGPPTVMFAGGTTPVRVAPGSLPQWTPGGGGGTGTTTTTTPPPPGKPAPLPPVGQPVDMGELGTVTLQNDATTGLQTLHGDKWNGKTIYVIRGDEDFAKVPSGVGALYMGPDREVRPKP